MDVIYWLIPISIVILFVAIAIFFWAVRSNQFEDLDSAAIDILFDNDGPELSSDNIKETKAKLSNSHPSNKKIATLHNKT